MGETETRVFGSAEHGSPLPNTAYDKAISTTRNLLAMGLLSLEQIAEATKLPLSEVAAL